MSASEDNIIIKPRTLTRTANSHFSIMFDTKNEIKKIEQEFKDLEEKITVVLPQSPEGIEVYKRYNRLLKAKGLFEQFLSAEKKLAEAKADINSSDSELAHLAQAEAAEAEKNLPQLEKEIKALLKPADPLDSHHTIMEIRAGTGGEEAALFARDLARLYTRFAERMGWRAELLSQSLAPAGGIKEIIFKISGEDVYRHLRGEGGVHRVQRVPDTEAQGRIHTSTATVAVMPEPSTADFVLDPKEVKIETSTSGGHGGQSVNTTYSAIRMTHLPTGLTVSCQDERSQQQNREKAWAVMTARVFTRQQEEKLAKEARERRAQVGSGERAEKIRTYNYPQDRVTDHRLEISWHNLPGVMDGDIEPIVAAVIDNRESQTDDTL